MSWKLIDQFATRPELDLPPHEAHVFFYLLHRAAHDGTAIYPSIRDIMVACRLGRREVQKILKSLEQKGYIIRINLGVGRNQAPLWNTPLDQSGHISPRPPAPGQGEASPAKPRPVRLVRPDAEEPFLDTEDQVTGKEVTPYQGYAPRQLRVVSVAEVSQAEQDQEEMERMLLEEFHKTLNTALQEAESKIIYRRAQLEKTRGAAGQRIMARLLAEAEAEYQELLEEQQRQAEIEMRKYR